MIQTVKIDELRCSCSRSEKSNKVLYILYPMDMLSDWIEPACAKYGVSIVVLTGMDWQNVFSPWPAKGVPSGTADFKGESPQFLKKLQTAVIPAVETALGVGADFERTLLGVSMSGLFALWQWMVCDTFLNIASLSGSFWYEGFTDWMASRSIPRKTGKAFFLLGDAEPHSKVKAFATVTQATEQVITQLRAAGIVTQFVSVPGNHYADPIPRLNLAMTSLFS